MYINCFVLCKEMVEIVLFEFMMIVWKKKTEIGKSKILRNVNKYEYCFGFVFFVCFNVLSNVLVW